MVKMDVKVKMVVRRETEVEKFWNEVVEQTVEKQVKDKE